MTTDTSIKPALTAEEWANESRGDAVRVVRDRGWSWLEVGKRAAVADLGEIVAIRALCNHLLPDDDPRKFTWADYDLWNGRNPEAQVIADKIKALLPPR